MNTLIRAIAAVTTLFAVSICAPAQDEGLPPIGAPKDFVLPSMETYTLDNGLAVTLVPFGRVPKVTIGVAVRAGNLNENTNTWLADMAGEMMKEGAGDRNAAAVAEAAAGMGGDLTVSVGPDSTIVSLDILSEFGADALALIGDVVMRPALPEAELARVKANLERNLSVSLSRPRSLAVNAFQGTLYPDHPYGRVLPKMEQLEGYDIAAVRAFHADNFGARRTHIYVAGRFDAAAIKAAINGVFGSWATGPEPMIDIPAVPQPALRVKLIDRPGAPQSTINLGLRVSDPSQPELVPLRVMNTLLGGAFSSRITTNIREDKGYTYSPRASIDDFYRAAHWVQVADVTTEFTGSALSEIFKELERLQAEPPSERELTEFKNYMAGFFILNASSRARLLTQLLFQDLHGLPADFLSTYVHAVQEVGPEMVSEMARAQLPIAGMTLVVVGDLGKITDQLKALPQLASVEFEVVTP